MLYIVLHILCIYIRLYIYIYKILIVLVPKWPSESTFYGILHFLFVSCCYVKFLQYLKKQQFTVLILSIIFPCKGKYSFSEHFLIHLLSSFSARVFLWCFTISVVLIISFVTLFDAEWIPTNCSCSPLPFHSAIPNTLLGYLNRLWNSLTGGLGNNSYGRYLLNDK